MKTIKEKNLEDYYKLSRIDLLYIYGGTEPGESDDEEDENNLVINLGKTCPTWGDCKKTCG